MGIPNRIVIIQEKFKEDNLASANVKWIGGKRFVGVDSTNHSVVLSTADEGVGMKPSDLLLVGLASCTSVDVVDILKKKKKDLLGLEVQVNAEQEKDPPWTFRKFHLIYLISGSGITQKDAEQAIQLSQEKYCSVASTLRGEAEITWEYKIVE
jgi:putative redox protein